MISGNKTKFLGLVGLVAALLSMLGLVATSSAVDYSNWDCEQLRIEQARVCYSTTSLAVTSPNANSEKSCKALNDAIVSKNCDIPTTPQTPSSEGKDKTEESKPAPAPGAAANSDGGEGEDQAPKSCDEFRGSNGRMCEASGAGSFLVETLKNNLSGDTMFKKMSDSTEWLKPYAVSFGLGGIILAITLMQGIAMSADGKKVSGWSLLGGVGLRAYIYFPAMLIAPALVSALSAMTNEMAESLMGQAGTTMLENMGKLFLAFFNPLNVTKLAGNTFAMGSIGILLSLILLVVALLALVIEITVVQFSTYLLAILLPMGIALSISPKMRKVGSGIVAGLVAVLLIKPAIWFALWIGNSVLAGALEQTPEGFLGTYSLEQLATFALMLAVLFATTAAVPMLAPSVLRWLMPSGGQAWGRPHMPGMMRYAGQRGLDSSVNSASRQLRAKSGSKNSISGGPGKASAKSIPSTSASSAASGSSGAAGASGAGAAGPIAAIVSVGKKMWDKFKGAAKDSKDSTDAVADAGAQGAGGPGGGEEFGPVAARRSSDGGGGSGSGRGRQPNPGGGSGPGGDNYLPPRDAPGQGNGGEHQGPFDEGVPRQPREPNDEPPKGGDR